MLLRKAGQEFTNRRMDTMNNSAQNPNERLQQTVQPALLIDSLDLETLPARLDDATLAMVQDIASSPLPPPEPASAQELNQCLRVLLAVLPKRNSDDVSGELLVAAYQRQLGHLSAPAVNFLADAAMQRCRWFPTIAECLDIAGECRRVDRHTRRKVEAVRIARQEQDARRKDERDEYCIREKPWAFQMSEKFIADLSPEMLKLGLSCRALRYDANGKVVEWFDDPSPDGEIPY